MSLRVGSRAKPTKKRSISGIVQYNCKCEACFSKHGDNGNWVSQRTWYNHKMKNILNASSAKPTLGGSKQSRKPRKNLRKKLLSAKNNLEESGEDSGNVDLEVESSTETQDDVNMNTELQPNTQDESHLQENFEEPIHDKLREDSAIDNKQLQPPDSDNGTEEEDSGDNEVQGTEHIPQPQPVPSSSLRLWNENEIILDKEDPWTDISMSLKLIQKISKKLTRYSVSWLKTSYLGPKT
ncbi:hypothetical protein M422DRAFT_55582 [Sphaerobolus stellatus SS14]|uniref:Uncharacterized protein n=1 Tax=Sphaerobolus stellatus (strain SS14) TaxID=990650 RepID=A0A0C9TWW5_SPHS4|nr:hypothetical protein M422DRAFT_55582 [Sphaerobolus stellatus SS14]